MRNLFRNSAFALATIFSVQTVSAAMVVPIVQAIGHQQGDTPSPGDGSLVRLINGAGLSKPDVDNIATWTHDTTWQNGWQGGGASNLTGNVGWLVLDLGAATENLDDLYLWNVNEPGTPLQRGVQAFKLWYALSPGVTPPASTSGSQSYDFSSGGWVQLGGVNNLTQGPGNAGQTFSGVFDLSGIGSARYLAIEAVTNYGSGFGGDTANRTGLAEVVVTAVPEPAAGTLALLSLGVTLLARRRSAVRREG
jgi:hypothetical protein